MKRTMVVTMGDPNGVGPEILLKAAIQGALVGDWFAVGDARALYRAGEVMGLQMPIHCMDGEKDRRKGALNLMDMGMLTDGDIQPGMLSAKAGEAAHRYIHRATELALAGRAAAIVTLPVNKEAVQLTVPGFTGHTEMIAQMCGQHNYTMMLACDKLTVTHVSTHVSMLEAVTALRRERVLEVIGLTRDALLKPLGREPRIAVAGLNAHAGEHGLFGREEIELIAPAIQDARAQGVLASGPHPPDTVFLQALNGLYDAVVCMYHDQGHIPLKLLDFAGGVNVTLGLRVIRTSVDHGTAFDIAYRGIADPGSLIKAYQMAAAMAGRN